MSSAAHTGTCSSSSRGVVHRWRSTLIPTTREAPTDAETPSHILLSRAGFIRKVAAGVYDYLPLAWRTLTKVSRIVREEMDAAGASELFMPVIVPMEFYEQTKRHETYGELLFKVTDRKGNVAALGPTHEETITELVKGSINSYKQLPLNLYQVQTKFRDEARPRAGLLRCREFIMKDAYSFHVHVEGPGGLNETYDKMYTAYSNIFRRCGLDYSIVEAESGPIGGSASHEFMVNCESGEDTILKCPVSGYAANVEKCEIGEREIAGGAWSGEPAEKMMEVHTPNLPGIEGVAQFLKVEPRDMLKTIVFKPKGKVEVGGTGGRDIKWVVAVVRGDHDVNEGKVKDAVGCAVELAPEKEAKAAGFAIGYVSPRVVETIDGVLMLVDKDAAGGNVDRGGWATGADKPDYHVKQFAWKRDVGGQGSKLTDPGYVKLTDVRNAMAGDPSPRAGGAKLVAARGIEVGHIFKLGTKYSDAMGLKVLDDKQQMRSVIMGCYGIGVSRTMAACVEMSHDADGIIWPDAIAPYNVLITLLKPDNPQHVEHAERLAGELAERGLDVLIDDRDERPGPKFKDADLVGFPIRLTIGEKALAEGAVEFKRRSVAGKGENVKIENVVGKCVEMAHSN